MSVVAAVAASRLEPCPFCGGTNVGPIKGALFIQCSCGAQGPVSLVGEEAEQWNRRAAPAAQAGVPEEVLAGAALLARHCYSQNIPGAHHLEKLLTYIRSAPPTAAPGWVTLQERFERMADERKKVAEQYDDRHEFSVSGRSRSAAEAYERCAGEVARVLSGEQPPPAGYDWPPQPPTQEKGK